MNGEENIELQNLSDIRKCLGDRKVGVCVRGGGGGFHLGRAKARGERTERGKSSRAGE